MTTAATSLLGLALPVTGELSGTWGDTVNNSLTSLLDTAVAGTTTLSSDADVTLTTTTLASNQARQAVILWTAGGTVTRNITAPAQSKPYIVINKTSSTQSIVLRGAGPTTGVTIVAGEKCLVVWNGVDFVKAGNTSGAGDFTTLSATGVATFSAGTAALPAITTTGDTNTGIFFPAADTVGVATGGSERLRVDSSGNVGIGTSSPVYQTQIYGTGQTTAALTDAGNKGGSLLLNAPTVAAGDGGALLIGAGSSGAKPFAAIKGLLADGAGNTIGNLAFSTRNATADTALTERMRIDSSGNLLVGTTSTYGAKFALYGTASGTNSNIQITNPGYGTGCLGVQGTSSNFKLYNCYTSGTLGTGAGIDIDTSGNVGIGVTSVTGKFQVKAATNQSLYIGASTTIANSVVIGGINDAASANIPLEFRYGTTAAFINSGTEAMRIDSSGNLLVGTTSGSGRLYVTLSSSTVPTIVANNQFAGSSGLNTFYSSLGNGTNSVANTNCYHLQAVSQGSAIYYLYGNGTTSFTSDQRLKKNIETTRNGYAQDLCKLRVVKYQWNTEPDDGPKELGLIAQEVEQVFPGLVQDAADEIQGIKPKVLKASVLPLMLLKAIQEQQALITSLTARLDAANL